jgi:crotonobetainyl-CoA:carnitine CoA-transferase CaiB-like acyl-CoA transferase
MDLLGKRDIPVEPVLSASEAREHPQFRERGLLSAGPDRLPRLGFPARLDGERPQAGGKAPGLGEQTKALLAELGMSTKTGRSSGVGPRFRWKRWLLRWFS